MNKIFIDGSAGTTGLRIYDRLSGRDDISLMILPEDLRKDISARKDYLNNCDVAVLCLPDAAAVEAVGLIENPDVKVIDTSTAHRVSPGWQFGFPEITGYDAVKSSKRIANPGCHASGFISLVYPLINAGIIGKDAELTCMSLTGYTGGGKKMIAEYEGDKPPIYSSPRQYGISQSHKHLPEMKAVTGLEKSPVFCPVVADFPCGMEVTVPLFKSQVNGSIEDIKACYSDFYKKGLVKYLDASDGGYIAAGAFAGLDSMGVSVYGNEDRMILVSVFDNLGKGASGSAIQNLNIILGCEETKGLKL